MMSALFVLTSLVVVTIIMGYRRLAFLGFGFTLLLACLLLLHHASDPLAIQL